MAMRCSLFLLIFALAAASTPAPAQESMPRGKPGPIRSVPKAAAKHSGKHHVTNRQAAKRVPTRVPLPPPKAAVASTTAPVVRVPLPQPAPPPSRVKPAPAVAAGAGVPPAERREIVSALLWAGDYSGAAKGEDPLVAAVKHYQKRHRQRVTGALTPAQRAALLAAARRYQNEFGWRVVVDPATGIRLGLPSRLVPHAHDAAHGTRWSSPNGAVQVETFRLKQPGLKLADLFNREKHTPPTRKVLRGWLHPDRFFLGGMQGLKDFAVYAALRDDEVRGFTVLYDQAMSGIVAPVLAAMGSAFSPFPARGAPFAALAEPVEYGTGLIVSGDGHIVTARQVADGCQVIVVPGLGDADRVAEDKADGLALIRVYGQHKLSALGFAPADPEAAPTSGALTLIGIPDPREQNGHASLTALKARLSGTAIELSEPVPIAGFSGAGALDAKGRVLGMMATRNAVVASNAPTAPPLWLVRASTIRAFLAAHHVPAVKTPAAEARDAVVRVICVRK